MSGNSVAIVSLIAAVIASVAMQGDEVRTAPDISPDEVIRRAAENEAKSLEALAHYSYKQAMLVQVFGEAGSVRSQLRRVSLMTYDDLGNRVERIIEYPPSPLIKLLGVMQPDFKALTGIDPFFLTPSRLKLYRATLKGTEVIDELTTYLFEVESIDQRPRARRKNKDDWPFKGRVWVDQQDLAVVKVEGRAITHADDAQRFPGFEYYREYIDDRYWFPSYLYGEEVLDFKRYDLPIKVEIRYTEYKRVRAGT